MGGASFYNCPTQFITYRKMVISHTVELADLKQTALKKATKLYIPYPPPMTATRTQNC
jgi:hypothetical protein